VAGINVNNEFSLLALRQCNSRGIQHDRHVQHLKKKKLEINKSYFHMQQANEQNFRSKHRMRCFHLSHRLLKPTCRQVLSIYLERPDQFHTKECVS
jgi:hypothetical protein